LYASKECQRNIMIDWCYFSSRITIFCRGSLEILISHDFFRGHDFD
jgi:hypothetical protein